MAHEVALGLGEYLTVWTLIAILGLGILGWLFGVAAGGVVLFIIAAALAVLITYAILSRGYRFLLHGDIRAGGDSGD